MIQVIKNARLPQFRFEWHPQSGKVYWLRVPTPEEEGAAAAKGSTLKVQAFILAEHCDTHGRAFGFVQTWSRGYAEGQKDPITLEIPQCELKMK